jgi:tetratricopeptide (TPR) repeat protein
MKPWAFSLFCVFFLINALSCSSLPGAGKQEVVTQNRQVAKQLMEQGNSQYDNSLLDTALENFNTALYLYSGIDYPQGTVKALLAISRCHLALGDSVRSLKSLEQALDIAKREGQYPEQRKVWNRFAEYFLKMGDYEKALDYCQSGDLSQINETSDIHSERYRILGTIEKKQGNYESALANFNIALTMDEDLVSYSDWASDLYLISSIYSLQGNYSIAMEYLNDALGKDRYIEYIPGVASDLQALAMVSQKNGSTTDALYYR